jgi:hypothetical protein
VDEAGDYSEVLHHFMGLRSVQGKAAPRQGQNGGHVAIIPGAAESYDLISELGKCFDLRLLCIEPCALTERDAALSRILAAAAATGVVFDVQGGRAPLHEQLETLRSRLTAAAKVLPYSQAWFDKDGHVNAGTVIMKDMLLTPALHADIGDILNVFRHAVLKGRNEAVVEGMGSMVSMRTRRAPTWALRTILRRPSFTTTSRRCRTRLPSPSSTRRLRFASAWASRGTSSTGQPTVKRASSARAARSSGASTPRPQSTNL